jgi:hypothetical protein
MRLLLIDPRLGVASPSAKLLGLEPKCDLLLGRLDGIGAVADVAPDLQSLDLGFRIMTTHGFGMVCIV